MAAVKTNSKYQIDMCHGPLFRQIVTFSIPLMFSGLLQMLFHAADLMVVGRFASHRALAAVGSTASLTHLLINVFFGLSVGTNVLVARYIGAKDRNAVSRTVHTAIYLSLAGGAVLALLGIMLAKPILHRMNTPDDILDMASLYMWIYFAGMPLVMLYNFGSSILRASGDTRRPFYFLVFAGIINVLLNLFFVIVCGWDVGGVATATVISQAVSASLVLRVLLVTPGAIRVRLDKLKIHWQSLREIMWVGIPAGFQASCFSIANLLIQSALNTFGSQAIAGCTAATTWEAFCFLSANAFGQASTSFVSQNLGGKQYNRIRQTVKYSCGSSVVILGIISCTMLIFAEPCLSLFNSDPEVIRWGVLRFSIILPFIFICGFLETYLGALRGLGYVAGPTVVMIMGVCVFRIIWLWLVFSQYPTVATLIWTYPISWLLIAAANMLYFYWATKKFPKMN